MRLTKLSYQGVFTIFFHVCSAYYFCYNMPRMLAQYISSKIHEKQVSVALFNQTCPLPICLHQPSAFCIISDCISYIQYSLPLLHLLMLAFISNTGNERSKSNTFEALLYYQKVEQHKLQFSICNLCMPLCNLTSFFFC